MAKTKKRLYGVFGITPELLEVWEGQLKREIAVWIENGKVELRLFLTFMEAEQARKQLQAFNEVGPYKLELKRITNC